MKFVADDGGSKPFWNVDQFLPDTRRNIPESNKTQFDKIKSDIHFFAIQDEKQEKGIEDEDCEGRTGDRMGETVSWQSTEEFSRAAVWNEATFSTNTPLFFCPWYLSTTFNINI
jgi:hypothetical protein